MHASNLSSSQCAEYFYKPDPIFGINSVWSGDMADGYKISGLPCKKHDFINLIQGNDLNGVQVIKDGRNNADEPLHRAAVDFPFAPPKSVSIMALHADIMTLHADYNDFILAHFKAVYATLYHIEKNYIYVRQTDNKNTVAIKTGSALFAQFNHSVSRSNDPQLHSHVLVFNHTVNPKGHRAVFFDQFYREQKLITQIYLSELAKIIRELGYGIEIQGDGKWEIAGVKQKWIQKFSKRTFDIKKVENEFLKTKTHPGARKGRLRRISVLESRPKKDSSIDEKQLKEQWEKEVPRELIKKSVEQCKNKLQPENKLHSVDYIQLVYHSIPQTECLFTRKLILENSLKLSVGHLTIADIEKGFLKMTANKKIVAVSKYINSKGLVTHHYTSKSMKATEQEILNNFRHDLNASDKFLSDKKAEKIISKGYDFLTNDQKKALQYVLTSKQQFMLVQGDAGTGKSFLFKSFKKILNSKNEDVRIQGLGFTGKAAQELQAQSGISSKTIASFLNEPVNALHKNNVFIVDEASMLGSLQANEIFSKAKVTNSKVIICGDCKQLQAVSAGKFFKDLQELKVPYVEMNQVLRQKNIHMLKTVGLIKDFQTGKKNHGIDKAFELFKKNSNLIEIPMKTELIKTVVTSYLDLKKTDDTLVITASNKDRFKLNENIRTELKKNGELGEKDIQTEISVPINLPGIKKYFSENYELKQQILIEQHDLKKDEKALFNAIIVAVDSTSNSFQVLTQYQEIKQIHLRDKNISTRITLYETQKRNFAINDKVVFLRNDKNFGVQNGLTGKMEAINNKGIFKIRTEDSSRLIKIDPKEFSYLDHAYAVSIHKSQGTTSPNVILLADTRYKNLNKTESLYVSVSRAEKQIKIFTNDINKLKEQFKNGQNKTSPLVPKHQLFKSNTKEQRNEREMER